MSAFLLAAALLLLAAIGAGMVRVLRGPTAGDRMLAAQLFGTTGVAILLILAEALGQPALVDVALVFALLAAVATVAFVRKPAEPGEDET
jgi:multicomponent Na+:H+ antiporter subunit F